MPPPYDYSGLPTMSEREPLLWNAGPSSRRQSSPTCAPEAGPIAKGGFTTKAWIVLWIATLFLAGFLSERAGHINERTIESTERTLLRKQWDAECTNHTLQIERFKTEEKDLRAQKREMIADYTQQERDLVVKIRGMVLDYTQEEERWQGKMEWYKRQERGLLRRQEEMEDTYRRREHAWQAKIERFKEEWQRMVDAEIRERERARLYWGDIQGAEHCIANGRKKYSARLANLTPSIDGMEACKATPITLNGVTYRQPISCENTGGVHGIRGHWIADNEGACAAYWEFVKPKDCTAPNSGYRRIETRLGVVHAGENPETLCLGTPLSIDGRMYDHPMACPDWGAHGFWGIWNVPDEQCN